MNKLDTYRLYLIRNGQKDSTIDTKVKLMKKVLIECPELTNETFSHYVLKSQEARLTDKYINQIIGSVRYWADCFDITGLKDFPYCKLRRFTDFIKATMSDEEIEAFLSLPYKGRRDPFYQSRFEMFTVFFSIQAYTGMRPGEVSKLKISDVDFGRQIFRAHGKTGPRDVPISPILTDLLQNYIKDLETDYLFPRVHKTCRTPYISPQAWQSQFNNRIQRLGIKRPYLTPYSLRHSFITRQVDEDVSIAKIQSIVGHKKLDTTAQYIHLSTKSLQEVIQKDRLSKRHLSIEDIMKGIYESLLSIEKGYQDKILMNVKKSSKSINVSFRIKSPLL